MDRRRILEEAAQPDASLVEIARRYGIARRFYFAGSKSWRHLCSSRRRSPTQTHRLLGLPPKGSVLHDDTAFCGREGIL